MALWDFLKHLFKRDVDWLRVAPAVLQRGYSAPTELMMFVEKKSPQLKEILERRLEESLKPCLGQLYEFFGRNIEAVKLVIPWLKQAEQFFSQVDSGAIQPGSTQYMQWIDALRATMPIHLRSFLSQFPWHLRELVVKGLVRSLQILEHVAQKLNVDPLRLFELLARLDEVRKVLPDPLYFALSIVRDVLWGKILSASRKLTSGGAALIEQLFGSDVMRLIDKYIGGLTYMMIRDLYFK